MFHRLISLIARHLHVREIFIDGQPYLRRYYVGRLFGVTCYLHHFLAPDPDQGLHDHPWRLGIAVPLTGGYIEERLDYLDAFNGPISSFKLRRPLIPYRLQHRDFHRIVELPEFDCWSLFFHTRRFRMWGFLKQDADTRETFYSQPHAHELTADSLVWASMPRGRDIAAP